MPASRLLCIEDDADVGELLSTYFRMVQFEVLLAPDGTSGLQLARTARPDLILLDVMLPDITGWEVARRLRTSSLTQAIPIIFLTQRFERKDKLTGLALGADDYITKPFDVDELLARVRGAIQRNALRWATAQRFYEPRTGLPYLAGMPGRALVQAMRERLRRERGWSRFRIRLEGLETLRDRYGFLAADEALAFAARTILDAVDAQGTPEDFVGMGEADQLLVVTRAASPDAFRQAVEAAFEAGVQALYDYRDLVDGQLVLDPGTPHETRVPLLRLQIDLMPA